MRKGFSLVELSIVLVILGLLTGGILAGQSLIRASELRAIPTEAHRYIAATNTFRGKYMALPGDMRNAASFWGSAGGSGIVGDGCEVAVGTGTQTCGGDADGFVLGASGAASQYREMYTYWQHMANAGLIEGTYNGRAGSGDSGHVVLGVNSPYSRLSSAGWAVNSRSGYNAGGATNFAGAWGNNLHTGAETAAGGLSTATLTPEEAWGIDTKTDDGMPGRGKVITGWPTCTTASSQSDLAAAYQLTTTSKACTMRFINAF